MGQAEKAQDNFWNLIGMAGNTALRVRSGMRLGVNEDDELSFMSSYAQIRLDVAEDGSLVISAAGEHEVVSSDGVLLAEPIVCHSLAEIRLRGVVLQVDRGESGKGEPSVVVEVRAKESADEPSGKQHLGGAIDSLLKPWPEPVTHSEDLQDQAAQAEPESEPELEPEPEAEREPESELETEAEPELRSEPESSSATSDLPLVFTVASTPDKAVQVTEPLRDSNRQGAAQAVSSFIDVNRWLVFVVPVLIVLALWLLATNVADTQAPAPLEITAEPEIIEGSEALPTYLLDESADTPLLQPPASSSEPRPPATEAESIADPVVSVEPTQAELIEAMGDPVTTADVEEPVTEESVIVEDTTASVESLPVQQPAIVPVTAPAVAESSDVSDRESAPQSAAGRQTEEPVEARIPEVAESESRQSDSTNNTTRAPRENVARNPGMEEPRRILLSADRALAQGRLVEPPESNAYELYSRVVALDPDIEEATAGLQAVRQGLINRALSQLATGNLQSAEQSLVAAAQTGANPIMVADLRNEVEYQIRIADAELGQFEAMYPFSDLVAVAQRPPRISRTDTLDGEVSVGVEFTVTTSGAVADVEVVSEVPEEISLAVASAVSDWQFEPVLFNRRPIPVRSSFSILLPN